MRTFEQTWLNEDGRVWEWDDIVPSAGEDITHVWNRLKPKFGHGPAGFSESTSLVVSSSVFGHSDSVPVRWTVYRSEDGEVLGIHACYKNAAGQQLPMLLVVSPGHRRKGIGTLMFNFVRGRFLDENGVDGDAEIAFRNTPMNTAAAGMVNKLVREDYARRNENA